MKKETESKNPRVAPADKGKLLLLPNCAVSDSKKSRFIKNQEASWLLSNLRLKTQIIHSAQ